MAITNDLIKLKEKITQQTSEIDKCKGKLSLLYNNLKKLGFKNIKDAKTDLKRMQSTISEKTKTLEEGIEKIKSKFEEH